MMNAIVMEGMGAAKEVYHMREVPVRPLKAHEVLVRVKAVGINPLDVMHRRGYAYRLMSLPRHHAIIPGRDASGVVERVGSAVWNLKPGDHVWGCISPLNQGTYAQYVVANSSEVSLKPKNLDWVHSAALPWVSMTAWLALVDTAGAVDPYSGRPSGKKVFINGASGPLGTFAIQLLRKYGCTVYGSASAKNLDKLKSLGVDQVVDYTSDFASENYGTIIKDADVVLDSIGDEVSEANAIKALKEGGHYLSLRGRLVSATDRYGVLCGVAAAAGDLIAKKMEFMREKKLSYDWVVNLSEPAGGRSRALAHVAKLVEEGTVTPVVDPDGIFNGLSEESMAAAHEYFESGKAKGKVIVTV